MMEATHVPGGGHHDAALHCMTVLIMQRLHTLPTDITQHYQVNSMLVGCNEIRSTEILSLTVGMPFTPFSFHKRH